MVRLKIKLVWIFRVAFLLGYTSVDKFKLFLGGLWLLIVDKEKSRMDLNVQLCYNLKVFPFRIADLGDFGTLKEVFCDEIYRMNLTNPVSSIIDIGSNIGASAVYFASCFPEALIYCFEPDEKAFNCLATNTRLMDNIFIHNKAIWSANTERIFYTDPHRTNSSSLEQRRARQIPVTVTTNTLDNVLLSLDLQSVDIIKFDCEGAEYDIFHAFEQYHKVRMMIGEVHIDLIGGLDRFTDILPEFYKISATALGHDRVNLTLVNTRLST